VPRKYIKANQGCGMRVRRGSCVVHRKTRKSRRRKATPSRLAGRDGVYPPGIKAVAATYARSQAFLLFAYGSTRGGLSRHKLPRPWPVHPHDRIRGLFDLTFSLLKSLASLHRGHRSQPPSDLPHPPIIQGDET
jgi:hypothetical protein